MLLKTLLTALKAPRKLALFRVMRDGESFLRLHFAYAAARTGLVEALRGPAGPDELRRRLGAARPELLDALLDLGVSLGELSLRNGWYRAKGPMMRAMQSEDGETFAAVPEAFVTYYNSIHRHLPERIAGAPSGDYLPEIGSVVARFSRLAEPYTDVLVSRALAGLDRARILDVGCGAGGQLRTAAAWCPGAEGLGLELDPEVAAEARGNLMTWGLAGRFRIIEGDIRRPPAGLVPPFDLVLFFNIAYYFPSDERPSLYRRLAGLLRPGGRLAVASFFQSHGRDPLAANLDIATRSMQGCWPLPNLKETKAQIREAGLRLVGSYRLMPGSTMYGVLAEQGS